MLKFSNDLIVTWAIPPLDCGTLCQLISNLSHNSSFHLTAIPSLTSSSNPQSFLQSLPLSLSLSLSLSLPVRHLSSVSCSLSYPTPSLISHTTFNRSVLYRYHIATIFAISSVSDTPATSLLPPPLPSLSFHHDSIIAIHSTMYSLTPN